jgi:UDP-2,3-diacylglucosamine pyrophosphatase LpxH
MKARTVFISDVHLGTPHCQHNKLLKFLKSFETEDGAGYNLEKIYLNGDIIDITCFQPKVFFSEHRTVIKKLLRMADKGVEVVYVGGNHEAPIRKDIFGMAGEFNGIRLLDQDIHVTATGKRYLVIHGDQFDGIINLHPIMYQLGDGIYKLMTMINTAQNKIRRLFNKPEWSFAHWIKSNAKSAVKFISNFELLVAEHAKKNDVDGVIAGHIHVPEDRDIDGIHYLNSGTWVEICSAVIEDSHGNMCVERF